MNRGIQGFSLLELTISIAVAAILLASLSTTTGEISALQSRAAADQVQLQQLEFALQRMQHAVTTSNRLLLPLHDNPNTDYTENLREQWVPAGSPVTGTTLATAVLAVALNPNADINQDGIPDADNDGDGRIDEDWPSDMTNDGAPGIVGLDDDGEGSVDEGFFASNDDDEILNFNEDPVNLIDDDNDGSVDEDTNNDMNGDGAPGIQGVDDDGDGNIDEGDNADDDEDGSNNEDWIDAHAFYLNGDTLIERIPVPWDANSDSTQDGKDYIEAPIATGVSYFKVALLNTSHEPTRLIEITLNVVDSDGNSLSQSRHLRLEQPR